MAYRAAYSRGHKMNLPLWTSAPDAWEPHGVLRGSVSFHPAAAAIFRRTLPDPNLGLRIKRRNVHEKSVVRASVRCRRVTLNLFPKNNGKVAIFHVVAGRAARFAARVKVNGLQVVWWA